MPFSSRCMTAADWANVKHFTAQEFRDHGGVPEAMGREFVMWLDRVREKAGVPMRLTSSHRTPEHNKAVRGAKDSAHVEIPCNAVDIGNLTNESRARILMAAIELGCIRWGQYANGSLHLDRTEETRPAPRAWTVVDNPA